MHHIANLAKKNEVSCNMHLCKSCLVISVTEAWLVGSSLWEKSTCHIPSFTRGSPPSR